MNEKDCYNKNNNLAKTYLFPLARKQIPLPEMSS